ncbi:hypothetical protein ADUPG1_010022 [Aduncisulcus paluster]|uniref:Uncharacterized protein n=1 Tax=Aduncisulcus paluster TaxID=2918883 RepID=A0ABQ5KZN1_9EUKA|nr:hypothetical protein ADUPG1_010022 [Aduncisulcus paluster]
MRIVGKVVVDLGTSWPVTKVLEGPYPVGHPDLSEIDGSKAYGDCYNDHDYSNILKLLRGKQHVFFFPNLHLPFITPHYLSKFVVSNYGYSSGIKDFNATFTTSDGNQITKEYTMTEMRSGHRFWQEFPIDILDVTSCDIHVISSWDGKQEFILFFGIRFVIDKKQEKMKATKEHEFATIERLSMLPWL